MDDYNIILQIAENEDYVGRVGQIKITGAGKESFITVTQDISDEIKNMYKKERASLLALFRSLNGNQWVRNDNWGSDKPFNEWYGVNVNEYGSVVKLDLPENNLSGALPPEIEDLSKLTNVVMMLFGPADGANPVHIAFDNIRIVPK